MNEAHSLDIVTYQSLDSDYAVRRESFVCALCGASVTHDPGKLTVHFIKRHPEVKLREYYELYVAKTAAAETTEDNPETPTEVSPSPNVKQRNAKRRKKMVSGSPAKKSRSNLISGATLPPVKEEPADPPPAAANEGQKNPEAAPEAVKVTAQPPKSSEKQKSASPSKAMPTMRVPKIILRRCDEPEEAQTVTPPAGGEIAVNNITDGSQDDH